MDKFPVWLIVVLSLQRLVLISYWTSFVWFVGFPSVCLLLRSFLSEGVSLKKVPHYTFISSIDKYKSSTFFKKSYYVITSVMEIRELPKRKKKFDNVRQVNERKERSQLF